MQPIYNLFEYCIDHRWAREALYWGGFASIIYNTFHLPAVPYAFTLLGGLLMYFSGLMHGTAMTEKHYEGRT